MHSIYLVCLLLSLRTVSAATYTHTAFKPQTTFVEVGARKLQTFELGEGTNTIIFEAGLGVEGKSWLKTKVVKTIAKQARIIAYNRAGYGQSTPSEDPRGIKQLADDLAAVIQAKAPDSKVIIVGHSLGGSIIRAYAIQHPDKVKALLFLDTNHEKFTQYANLTPAQKDQIIQQQISNPNIGVKQEAEQLIANIPFLKSLPNLPDVPVTVITSVKLGGDNTQAVVDDWASAHRSLGAGVSKFTHIKTNKSGHFIYLDEPKLVIESIRALLK